MEISQSSITSHDFLSSIDVGVGACAATGDATAVDRPVPTSPSPVPLSAGGRPPHRTGGQWGRHSGFHEQCQISADDAVTIHRSPGPVHLIHALDDAFLGRLIS